MIGRRDLGGIWRSIIRMEEKAYGAVKRNDTAG